MKKFDRLPPEQRKEEIQAAALRLFGQKGFAATTMENIVEQVSLSKGGVYRLYPSTAAILEDLMLKGMHLRNAYYEQRAAQRISDGNQLTLPFLVEIIGDSLLLYPEISGVYVEFLWEKKRNPKLEALYETIFRETLQETMALIRKYGAEELLPQGEETLAQLAELMNAAALGLRVLDLQTLFTDRRDALNRAILTVLTDETN